MGDLPEGLLAAVLVFLLVYWMLDGIFGYPLAAWWRRTEAHRWLIQKLTTRIW